jgi:serine phosphatase RsbU (regulator of sigma subunit)
MRLRNIFPLRLKIIGIVTLSLVASLGSIFVVSSALIVEDKTTYVLDYSLIQVRSAARAIDSQIESVVTGLRLLEAEDSNESAAKAYAERLKSEQGLRRLLVLGIGKDGSLKLERAWNDNGTGAQILDQLGWTTPRFRREKKIVARSPDGSVAVAIHIEPTQRRTEKAYVAWIRPDPGIPEGEATVDLHVLDTAGEVLFSSVRNDSRLPGSRLRNLARPVLTGTFDSGVQTWTYKSTDFVAGYQRLKNDELWVFSIVPRDIAFAAVQGLLVRTLALGLCILFIAIGLTLITVKQVTEGLRQMAAVVSRMNSGTFQYRVDTRGMSNDEIGMLASSFNLMADRIDELMVDAARKVERKHEKQVIEVVHNHILPEKPYDSSNIQLAGSTLSAKDCGGDWWNYVKIGDYLVWVMGKVDGRGLAPAVISAAAHGAFTTYAETTRLTSGKTPDLKLLLQQINRAVFEAGRGKAQAQVILCCFNTMSGRLEMMNLSHSHPLLHRIGFGGRPENDAERYSLMEVERFAPLGRGPEVKVKSQYFQLKPEDLIIFNSRGVTENLQDGAIYKSIAHLYDDFGLQAGKIAPGMTKKFSELWKLKEGDYPPDDVTTVVVAVPKKAYFMQVEEDLKKAVGKAA